MVEEDDDVAATAAATTTTTVFPVVLYDGERETNVGNIEIHPDLVYKEFQTMLSQLIGISYNNLTTYLVDSMKSKMSPDRRKFLITGKVNFAVIVEQTNCYFLVVLKRSRRDRRKQQLVKHSYYSDAHFYDDRLRDLLMHRDNYNYDYNYMNMILNSYGLYGFDSRLRTNFPRIEDAYPRVYGESNRSMCEECRIAEKQGEKAEFHLCVNDEVVVGGFRSPAGPVSRPV
ncbi:hypothetical protein Hdeb2414_s0007g00257051 [Helianthus debilis subsp. tardiflorus]